MSATHLSSGIPDRANPSSFAPGVSFQTAVVNRTLQDTRRGHRRRERLTLVYEILLKLMPPDKHVLKDFWITRFSNIPTDNLPFESPSLSVHDLARAVNLQEGRLIEHVHTLRKNGSITRDGDTYSITSRGVLVFYTIDAFLNNQLIRPLIKDLERTTHDTHQGRIFQKMQLRTAVKQCGDNSP